MKLLNKTKTEWCAELAYAIGLIATDGNLSKDGRHINFTSKDKQLAGLFAKCLNLQTKITMKGNGFGKEKKYYFIQFGDKNFYNFLQKIGITPRKSKTISFVKVPAKYFFDFRGVIPIFSRNL